MASPGNAMPAKWPAAEQGIRAVLDACGIYSAVKERVILSHPERSEAAEGKRFERELDVKVGRAGGEREYVLSIVNAILAEISGSGFAELPTIRDRLQELAFRLDVLAEAVPVVWASQEAVDYFVLSRIVMPWAGAIAAECVMDGVELDTGMPGGRFWFLPTPRDGRVVLPLNNFFDWWRDLVGSRTRVELAKRARDILGWENVIEEIAEWASSKADLPSLRAIDRVASIAEQLGRAKDCEALDVEGPLQERLGRCIAFARRRGLDPDALAFEIPTDRDAIRQIFSGVMNGRRPDVSPDVCERFVFYMRRRWSVPRREDVRARLIVARGVQKLYTSWRERFGERKALGLSAMFEGAYNVVVHSLVIDAPDDREELREKILTAPGGSLLFGLLTPPGSRAFLDHATAFVVGCPERFEQDTIPTADSNDRRKALQVLNLMTLDAVDAFADLQIAVPDGLVLDVTLDDGQLAEFEGRRERFLENVRFVVDVLAAPDVGSVWLSYVRLPDRLPPSRIHAAVAQRIMDEVADVESSPFWTERLLLTLARAQDPSLGPAREAPALLLEAWWRSAPHRAKRAEDVERVRFLLRRIRELEPALNGWSRYERLWREARLLVQLGDHAAAVRLYEELLKCGTANLKIGTAELAAEALAVSAVAGKSGRFKTMLRLAKHNVLPWSTLNDEDVKAQAAKVFRENFTNPYPRS